MDEPIDPKRSDAERTLWHTLDEAGWSADQIRESFDAYRDAILREAADKIRRMAYAMRSCDGTWDEEFSNEYVSDALGFATDLIDPDNA